MLFHIKYINSTGFLFNFSLFPKKNIVSSKLFCTLSNYLNHSHSFLAFPLFWPSIFLLYALKISCTTLILWSMLLTFFLINSLFTFLLHQASFFILFIVVTMLWWHFVTTLFIILFKVASIFSFFFPPIHSDERLICLPKCLHIGLIFYLPADTWFSLRCLTSLLFYYFFFKKQRFSFNAAWQWSLLHLEPFIILVAFTNFLHFSS